MALPAVPGSESSGTGGGTVQSRGAAPPCLVPHGACPPRPARTFGPHGRRAVVRHWGEDAGVIADVGIGLPADVAIVRVEGGGAGDERGTN